MMPLRKPIPDLEDPLEVAYPDLMAFLADAARFLSLEKVFYRTLAPLPAGTLARLRLQLPLMNTRLDCRARVSQHLDDGVVFEIQDWRRGHREQLWRFVALTWDVLKAAAHPGLTGPKPEPAARTVLQDVVRLEAPDQAGERSRGDRTPDATQSRPPRSKASRSVKYAEPAAESPAPPSPAAAVRSASLVRYDGRPLALLLNDLMTAQQTGWLEVSAEGTARRIRLELGQVVQLEQRPHADIRLLATVMTAVGQNWTQLQHLREKLERDDAPEAFLAKTSRMPRDMAERILSRRLSVQIARAIEEGWSGDASFQEEQSIPDLERLEPSPPVPLARMIWDGLRARAYDLPTPRPLSEALFSRPVRWNDSSPFPIAEASGRVEEQGFIHRCRSDLAGALRQIREADKHDRMPLAIGWCLLQVGLLTVEQATEDSQAGQIDMLTAVFRKMQGQNYFEVLELHWSAHPDDIQPAYDRLLAHFQPYLDSPDREVARWGYAISRHLLEAYVTLNKAVTRHEYRRNVIGPDVVQAIKQAMQQAELHDLRDEKEAALRCFEQVVDLAPNRADYRERLAIHLKSMGRTL